MKLNSIDVQGFRSFIGSQRLDLSALVPGLYHVTGRNEVNLELGANAVGKSSLFDAFYWACKGQTSAGVRAAAVKNWSNSHPCAVALDLVGNTGQFIACRMQAPNMLVVEDSHGERPVDQQTLELMMGMPADVLLHAVYFSQFRFNRTFVDLEPREQTELFTQVLDLYIWEQAAEEAKALAARQLLDVQQAEVDMARMQGQFEELGATDYAQPEREWGKSHAHQLKQYEAELGVAVFNVDVSGKHLAKAKNDSDEFRRLIEQSQQHARTAKSYFDEGHRLSDLIAELQGKVVDKCPACGAPVSADHIKREITKNKMLQKAAIDAATEAGDRHDGFVRQAAPYRDAEVKRIDAERSQSAHQSEVESLQKQLITAKAAKNPYTKLRLDADSRGEALVLGLEAGETALIALRRELAASLYWIKGFKELRLQAIHTSLTQLDVEVNAALGQLGLPDWRIIFDVESETKSGSIRRNFSTMVAAPHIPGGALPWEAWCGGEQQRLRLGIMMGFSDLVSSRLSVRPNFEFWDEPSQWMVQAGIVGLLEMLVERAKQQQKVILIADHHSVEFGGFAGTINIVKDKKGSRIEVKG